MDLDLIYEARFYKKLFTLKCPQRNGLILILHHKKSPYRIRFKCCSFNKPGQIMALLDVEGNVFVVDLNNKKYWAVPKTAKLGSVIQFSSYKPEEVLIGLNDGSIEILNIESGVIGGVLTGHKYPITGVSFYQNLCLTCSSHESIIWDLATNTRKHVLRIDEKCTLKYVAFIPASGRIITIFNDDFIQIWTLDNFEIKAEISSDVWKHHEMKSIAFTLDGKIMVLGCRPHYLFVFHLNNFKLRKSIVLPDHVQVIKQIQFVPQSNDGGANQILAILTGKGVLYYYNLGTNVILNELGAECEISKFEISSGNFMGCVLSSGDVSVHTLEEYCSDVIEMRAITPKVQNRVRRNMEKVSEVKQQMREILDIQKLTGILKNCGEYPRTHRRKIWERLLELPNNQNQYNAIINHRMIISFDELCTKYPLENHRHLKNLKQLLDNLVSWTQFFFQVDYLPLFVFPFVKMFHNQPITCFETVATIILNWCQFWFEYFPLPPLNILGLIENMLMEHDSELLSFLQAKNITSQLYAWPILKTAFSEILTAPAWETFWDHVLTNDPGFLLCGVVAYNILQRSTILKLNDPLQFESFYHTHHLIDVKRLLSKTYNIMGGTSEGNHPGQFLKSFAPLEAGEYPRFYNYPKVKVDVKGGRERMLKEEVKDLKSDEIDLFRGRLANLNFYENFQVEEEEARRKLELEHIINTQTLEQQERVHSYYEKLALLRQKFKEEDDLLTALIAKIRNRHLKKNRLRDLSTVVNESKICKYDESYKLSKIEDELLGQYSNLLQSKCKIEDLLKCDDLTSTRIANGASLKKHQEDLSKQLSVMIQLKIQTRELVTEVNNLLMILANLRNERSRE